MNKIIYILPIILITGCSSAIIPPVEPIKIQPDSTVMADCSDYFKVRDGKFASFVEAYTKNSEILSECKKLNDSKKDFIERSLK